MPNIFISYRREDSLGHTGRLFDGLGKHFGKTHVFMDIAGIEPGLDFVEAIDKAVGSCDVFIVVIGKQWLNATDADGRRRLDNPEDFIRLELATALRRNIRVIPVLVQGATAPSSENLPEDLKMLSRRQAIEVSDNRWDFDVGELIKTIEKSLKTKYPLRFWWSKIPRWAIVVFIVILFSAGVTIFLPPEPPIEPVIEMPNVVGERFEKAKVVLADKGLSVSTSEKQTGEKPPGTVVGQKPEPGTKMKKGDRVDLILAVRTVIKMPNVIGKQIEEAKEALQEAGLAVPAMKPIKTNEKSPGIVLNQTPKPDAEVEPVQKVVLEVAVKSGISVPNVVGEPFDKARAILAEKGLEVLKIEKQTDKKPPGTVVDQNPRQGKEMEKGQRVELVVASEPIMEKERQRQIAKKLAEEWVAAFYLRQDFKALMRMASLPFFFYTEVLIRFEDIEKKYKDMFSQMTSKGEDLSKIQLRVETKAQTIAEWKKEGHGSQGDRFVRQMEYKDGDFRISIVLEKDNHKHGVVFFTRNVGGEIKMAGFWM